MAIGNHDYDDVCERKSTTFDEYVPQSRFSDRFWWDGAYDETAHNTYATFEALGEAHIVVTLELFPRDEVVDWVTDVFSEHPDHRALLLTHGYLYYDGTPIDDEDQWDRTGYDLSGNNGDELWEGLVSRHENLVAVFCGHALCEDGPARRTTCKRHGNRVHQFLTNYQTLDDGGRGYLRLVRFYPTENVITAETYSPYLEEFHCDPDHHVRIDDAFEDLRNRERSE